MPPRHSGAGKGGKGKGKGLKAATMGKTGTDTGTGEKKKRRRLRKSSSFGFYIFRVLKQVHADISITRMGMCVMDSFVLDMFERFALEAGRCTRYNKKKTMTAMEIQTAVRLVLTPELAKHAISEGTKAINRYALSKEKEKRNTGL